MPVDHVKGVIQGSLRSLARIITLIENESPEAPSIMEQLYPHTGKAYVIGITGVPGSGKSTLTDKLTQHLRSKGLTVGIAAVDPSSPFSGGAILGDRIRMSSISGDRGVYFRSMATRGFLGGISKAAGDVVKVMDAFGKDIILVETVGVGQDEVDIMNLADTTCLVLAPGLGDTVQNIKAGVMEIADVFVINKSDLPGAEQLCTDIMQRVMEDSHYIERTWTPPVLQTVAASGDGVSDFYNAVMNHRENLMSTGEFSEKRSERARREIVCSVQQELLRMVMKCFPEDGKLDQLIESIHKRETSPHDAALRIIEAGFSGNDDFR